MGRQTKEYFRRRKLKQRYGITPEEYEQMLIEQDYCCYICKKPPASKRGKAATALHVDHCHQTGKVRKLLCQVCNMCIHPAEDNIGWALEVYGYLLEHQS
jgi:hypothetical protein